ncbi:enoyl-CoA hydratase-related protein [Marinobacter lutaoensis]|uniref:Enoyl-CoA hydratase n=1 Tax=Marinobacter lutaoensis TaxID=135739 RepID=A0A1V2DRJ7_9GAMM|nr:enoyl-CoA hydratase-related protein [Marinobacter lutaoensis]MBI44209.1 enoyl-CoA hydratase [Oceanospirillales bacterium]ONF43016.1 enoyl-CoA hydratase [Marinobacter lutaoensis]|tara:strand:- start:6 stop:785 length:780 start_codon:yes stop_codon:yes gene_type:complete
MPTPFIRCESYAEGYAELIIDRPAARNALCRSLTDEMAEQLARLADDTHVRVVLLRAEGEHFAAGADLKEMLGMSAEQARATDFAGCCAPLGSFPKPVVALVQGFALGGGCELVEMCDIVLAAENAVFGHPEVRVGTMPGAGGSQRLPRLVGMAKALDLLLTGRRMEAHEAERSGLVSRVVPTERLLEEGRQVAADLASLSGEILRLIKQTARAGADLPLEQGLRQERAAFHHSLSLPDRVEGMTAFLEKRAPRFNSPS